MQAITTKYLPWTNTKPGRIKASCQSGSVIIDSDSDSDNGHKAACEALRAKLGWTKSKGFAPMVGGDTKDGMVWVSAAHIDEAEYHVDN